MSSFASEPRRFVGVAAAAIACGACATPAPIYRDVEGSLGCSADRSSPIVSVAIELWRASEEGASCSTCRGGDASCELLERRCVELDPPVLAGEDLALRLEGQEFSRATGAVCVQIVGATVPGCGPASCVPGSCLDEITYCATGLSDASGGVVVAMGPGIVEVCVPPALATLPPLQYATIVNERAECMGGTGPLDAGRPRPDAR